MRHEFSCITIIFTFFLTINNAYAEKSDKVFDLPTVDFCSANRAVASSLTTLMNRLDNVLPVAIRRKNGAVLNNCQEVLPLPCDSACKTVTTVCEVPSADPNLPAPPSIDALNSPAPPSAEVMKRTSSFGSSTITNTTASAIRPSDDTSSGNNLFPCPGSLCVQNNPGGACNLYIGKGMLEPYWSLGESEFKCGATLTVDEWKDAIHNLRNSLDDIVDIIISLQNSGKWGEEKANRALIAAYFTVLSSCGLLDEHYHVIDPYRCMHHDSCVEAGSGDSNLRCIQDPFITVGSIKSILEHLTENKNEILKHYCSVRFSTELSVSIEECVCALTRNSSFSPEACDDCVSKKTSSQTNRGLTSTPNRDICAGVLSLKEIEDLKSGVASGYRDPRIAQHTCQGYEFEYCVSKYCDKQASDYRQCVKENENKIWDCAAPLKGNIQNRGR